MENNLPEALSNSIINDSVEGMADIFELGIDSFLDDGIAKDIPLISTVVGMYKVGKSINELFLMKKLRVFVNAINSGSVNEREREKYKAKILQNAKLRQAELERIIILINHYLDEKKPGMLAKLYLAYLDEKINWEETSLLAEIVDRLLPGDFELLQSGHEIEIKNDEGTEKALRLVSLGLMQDEAIVLSEDSITLPEIYVTGDTKIHKYFRTNLGDKFVLIIT